jgi:serine phosphatase RsbU (regulator of sigma subunit)
MWTTARTPRARGDDETIQLQQKLARVQSLLEAARKVHSTICLDDVLSGVLELAAKELEAQGAFLVSAATQLAIPIRVYGRVPEDWTHWTEETANPQYASVPLTGEHGDTLAHLVVYRPTPLLLEEQDFLEGLALQSALAVKNARYHERMIEWERVQLDLDAARAIQRSLQPRSAPEIGGYSLCFRSTACYEVGGDYVDVMPLADGRVMIAVADVAGKGLASALISMSFRSSFRAISSLGLPLPEMAARLNTLHWEEGTEARLRYVTLVLVCLDPRAHTIELVNAGHCPAVLKWRRELVKIKASGPPLGMLPDRRYQSEMHSLPEESQLLLYTDGLTEVFRGEEEFGEDRLVGLMESRPAADFLDHVWATLGRFSKNTRQTDDMTALYLYRAASGGDS